MVGVNPITMDRNVARGAYNQYAAAVRADRADIRRRWRDEDLALVRGYRELARGRAIVDVADAMKAAGVREDGYPRLAIVRADADRVFVEINARTGAATFALKEPRGYVGPRQMVTFPNGTFPRTDKWLSRRGTLVPMIPPPLRPKASLENFYLLWEVASWDLVPPKDPMLLKNISGLLYAVVAVWDLTPLEQAVLRSTAPVR